MTVDVFGPAYADAYDALYRSKDYAAECDVLERVFRAHRPGGVQSILDLGCGTGTHALILAGRGYRVVGVDRSAAMVAGARRKAREERLDVPVVEADARTVDLGTTFSAVVMMFAVLGYQLTHDDLVATLRTARRHLLPGGLLAFDVWYGPAVLAQRPGERVRVLREGGAMVLRTSESRLRLRDERCDVRFRLWRLEDGALVSETEELHCMRFFFPLELDLLLELAGFRALQVRAFPEVERDPDESTWSVLVVAEALPDRRDGTAGPSGAGTARTTPWDGR